MSEMYSHEELREINDFLRTTLCSSSAPEPKKVLGRLMVTKGVFTMPEEKQFELLNMVKNFDDFSQANDPYGEHDFGKVTIDDVDYFWKFDYYDKNFRYYGHDVHVLTVMRADEY